MYLLDFLYIAEVITTFLSLFWNGLLIFLVLSRTTTKIGFYKWIMISYAVFEGIYALIIFLAMPANFVVSGSWMLFIQGPFEGTKYALILSALYCTFYQIWIEFLAIHFLYRYIAICRHNLFGKIRQSLLLKTGIALILLCFVGSSFICGLVLCPQQGLPVETLKTMQKEFNKTNFSNVGYIVLRPTDLNGKSSLFGIIAIGNHAFLVLLSLIIIIYCGFSIIRKIRNLQKTTSRRMRLQKQLVRSLFLQTIVPLILCHIPTILYILLPLINDKITFKSFYLLLTWFTSFEKFLDPIIVIFCISEYRNVVTGWVHNDESLTSDASKLIAEKQKRVEDVERQKLQNTEILDETTTIDFLGWVISSCSFACAIANPIFGYWNQKTMSVRHPTIFGFVISAIGQLLYGLLPLFPSNQKWIMIVARLITGFGTGNHSVLRAYNATAPVAKDRLAVISYGTAGYVLGISFGPAIQALFTPIGTGWNIGPLPIDMYTLPPFVMFFVTLASCPVMWFNLKEEYAGILSEEDKKANNVVIPEYDMPAVLVCVWLWVCTCLLSTNIDVMSTPMTTAMYGWNDPTSVLNNGIIQCLASILSVFVSFSIGYTRIGKIDKRKHVIFGLVLFLIYHIAVFPWSFYPGPLKYIPNGTTTSEIGGCDPSFKWCETTTAVPMPIFIFSFIFLLGIAFPFVGSPSTSLFSEIIGPRPQGMSQGMISFAGSAAQFAAPILSTSLFKDTGYIWVIVINFSFLVIAMALTGFYYRRLKPLRLKSAVDHTNLLSIVKLS